MEAVKSFLAHGTVVSPVAWGAPFLQGEDGQHYLVVPTGSGFGVRLENQMDAMRAYPAVLVAANGTVRNLYWTNPLTNVNEFPSNNGMLELGEKGSKYCVNTINGFSLPNRESQLFVMAPDGAGMDGFNANRLRVYVRTPLDAEMTIGKLEHLRRMSRDTIGGGEVVIVQREYSHVGYNADAKLLIDLTVLTPEEAERRGL